MKKLVTSKTAFHRVAQCKLAIAFVLSISVAHSVAHNVYAESTNTSTVVLSIADRVGEPKGLMLQAVNISGTIAAEMSNVSSTVFRVPSGTYNMRFHCGKGVVKDQKVSLLHDCSSGETAGSLCQGKTAVVSVFCN